MIVGVPRESFPAERRVALVPAVISNLAKAGLEVVVEAGAGLEAGYPDADYVAKGAKILPARADVFGAADIITQVLCYGSNDRTGKADLSLFHRDQVLVGFLRPLGSVETIQDIASEGITAFSVELMPRTTRAQGMDALSAMATVAGYKAVLIAADALPKLFPHADNCRRNDHPGAGADPRRWSRRPSGDRYGAPPGCGGFGVRFTPGR
jgi:proton-translocating NAD(P)+ transhydrogenase subunit alpha